MTPEELNKILVDYESADLEFKQDISTGEKDREIKAIVAFSNCRGGKIILGVKEDGRDRKVVGLIEPQSVELGLRNKIRAKCLPDPDPKIEFVKIAGYTCMVVTVPKGEKPPYRFNGTPLLRRGSGIVEATEEEVATLYRDRSTDGPEMTPVITATVDDLDLSSAAEFLKAGSSLPPSGESVEKILFRMGLISESAGALRPTIAGLLLFGKNPQQFLPHAKIKADVKHNNDDTNWDDLEEITGTIFEQAKKCEDFVRRNMARSARVIGFERVEQPDLPIEALREAVVNALVHRDYGVVGSEVLFQIRADIVKIANPGRLMPPLTMGAILSGSFSPSTRNPILASALVQRGLMDKRGSGFFRMKKAMRDYGLQDPAFNEYDGGFEVSFYFGAKHPDTAVFIPAEDLQRAKLEADHQKILRLIESKEKIRATDCASLLGISKPTALKRLEYLLSFNLIEKVANNPTDPETVYRLHSRFKI